MREVKGLTPPENLHWFVSGDFALFLGLFRIGLGALKVRYFCNALYYKKWMPASTNCRARGGRFSRLDTGGCFLRATRLPVRIPVALVVVLVLSIKVLVEYTMLPSELAVEAAMGTAGVRLTMEGLVGSVEILVPFLVLFA